MLQKGCFKKNTVMKKEHSPVKSKWYKWYLRFLLLIIITGISVGSMSRSVYAAGKTVQIRLRPCGGEVSKKFIQAPKRGTVGRLPKARRTGYVFTGWTLSGSEYDFDTPVKSNITLVAVWNTAGVELPSSGGPGTTWIYLIGSILLLGCGITLIARRRIRT